LAQCNDGSPAAYYYAPGSGSSAHLWVVYLEGSMFCWGQASCSGASTQDQKGTAPCLTTRPYAASDAPAARFADRYATHDYWSACLVMDMASLPRLR